MTDAAQGKPESRPQRRLLPRFLRHTAARWRSVVLAVEFTLLVVAVLLAVYLRFFTYEAPLQAYTSLWLQLARAAAFALFIMFGLTAMGLYQAHLRETWFGALARQSLAFLLGATGLLVLYYVLPGLALGRGVLGLALLLGFALVGLFRVASARLFDLEPLKRRVLVLGSGNGPP